MDNKRDEVAKYGGEYKYFSFERPWGYQECLCENAGSATVKVVHVSREEMLSLQRHKNRDQLYYLLDDMTIQYEDAESMIVTVDGKRGDTFWFPRGTLHRAINRTDKEHATFFEVAFGNNDESDIVRVADKYART